MSAGKLDQLLTFFYRPQGRIARGEYALGVLFIWAVSFAILSFVVAQTGGSPGWLVFTAILGIPLTVAFLVLVVKRCHDLGLPGSFVLLLAVPVAGFVWIVVLMMIPGNSAPNLYGPAPAFRRHEA